MIISKHKNSTCRRFTRTTTRISYPLPLPDVQDTFVFITSLINPAFWTATPFWAHSYTLSRQTTANNIKASQFDFSRNPKATTNSILFSLQQLSLRTQNLATDGLSYYLGLIRYLCYLCSAVGPLIPAHYGWYTMHAAVIPIQLFAYSNPVTVRWRCHVFSLLPWLCLLTW